MIKRDVKERAESSEVSYWVGKNIWEMVSYHIVLGESGQSNHAILSPGLVSDAVHPRRS